MLYSKNDVYPGASSILPTVDQTVVENDEEMSNTYTDTASGQRSVLNTKMIWGALLLLGGVMVGLHFLGGE